MSHKNPPGPSSLPELPPEIRFEPLGCPLEVIDEANARERRTGVRAFEPVKVAIDRIRIAEFPSERRLESWCMHPDERVPIALLANHSLCFLSEETTKFIMSRIVPRAIREAQQRGEVWTALLEALSRSRWDIVDESLSRYNKKCSQKHYLETVVGPWVARQKDPNVLHHVVRRTKCKNLIRHVAKTAIAADFDLLNATIEAFPVTLRDWAFNDHLSPELQNHLLDQIVRTTTQGKHERSYGDYPAVAYRHLADRGVFFDPKQIKRLASRFDICIDQFDQPPDECDHIVNILNQHVRVTGDEEVALLVIEMIKKVGRPRWVVALLKASELDSQLRITPRLGHAVLDHFSRYIGVLEALIEHSEVRQDPGIRRRLLESHEPVVLATLAQDRRSEEFPLLFQRLAIRRPRMALSLLKDARDIARQTLSPADLLPLLQASSPAIRLEALAFLSDLEETPKFKAPPPQRRFL